MKNFKVRDKFDAKVVVAKIEQGSTLLTMKHMFNKLQRSCNSEFDHVFLENFSHMKWGDICREKLTFDEMVEVIYKIRKEVNKNGEYIYDD